MALARYPSRFHTTFELGTWRGEGTVENMGAGGVFIGTATIPARGEKVWLEIESPDGSAIEATGIVWWTTLDWGRRPDGRAGFGVRLVGASRRYGKLLRRLAR
jgi:hypothetical protein